MSGKSYFVKASAINFSITAQSSAYVDLKSSVLNVKLRLTNGDGTPMNEAIVAGLVNTPLHSIFRQVDVTFQQTLSHSGNNYPYKAYIDTILKTNENVQKGELPSLYPTVSRLMRGGGEKAGGKRRRRRIEEGEESS